MNAAYYGDCSECWRKSDCGWRCKEKITTHDIIMEIESQILLKTTSLKKLKAQYLEISGSYPNLGHKCQHCYRHRYCCKGPCAAILGNDITDTISHEIKTRRIAMGKLREQKISLQGGTCSYDRIEQNLGGGGLDWGELWAGLGKNGVGWSWAGDQKRGESPQNPQKMSTFCCENCQEAVKVPTDMLGDELLFKCPSCHQENHYDLS